jgi:succinyl-CoA synthetase alpha subunit
MGHAGAIISGAHGTAAEKMEALKDAGAFVANTTAEIGKTLLEAIAKHKK